MITHQDLIRPDQMLSHVPKIRETADRLCLEVEEKETSDTKAAHKKYTDDDTNSVKGRLEEQRPARVKPFMQGLQNQASTALLIWNATRSGPSWWPHDSDGRVALLGCHEGAATPCTILFKDGLEMEKC